MRFAVCICARQCVSGLFWFKYCVIVVVRTSWYMLVYRSEVRRFRISRFEGSVSYRCRAGYLFLLFVACFPNILRHSCSLCFNSF